MLYHDVFEVCMPQVIKDIYKRIPSATLLRHFKHLFVLDWRWYSLPLK